eukprot:m.33823 g.33823  ORF g.33823 m.33823 type:complete len:675 (-) comp6477_c0_seq1:118-2142(-)
MGKKGSTKGNRKVVRQSDQRKLRKTMLSEYALAESQLFQIWPADAAIEEQRMSNFRTIYLVDNQPVLFTYEPKGEKAQLLPTLYFAHIAPLMLPCLRIAEGVKRKICSKNDRLFMPGVVLAPKPTPSVSWVVHNFGKFSRGDKVFLRESGEWMPFAIAEWMLDWKELEMKGNVGQSLDIIHHIDDEIWMMGGGEYPDALPETVAIAQKELEEKRAKERQLQRERERAELLLQRIEEAKEYLEAAPKLLRNSKKKLRIVEALREKITSEGKDIGSLENDQQEKLSREVEMRAEVEEIERRVVFLEGFLIDPKLSDDDEEGEVVVEENEEKETIIQPEGTQDINNEEESAKGKAAKHVSVEIDESSLTNDEETNENDDKQKGTDGENQSDDVDVVGIKSEVLQEKAEGNEDEDEEADEEAGKEENDDDEEEETDEEEEENEGEDEDEVEDNEMTPDEVVEKSLCLALKTTLSSELLPILASNASSQHIKPAAFKMNKGLFSIKTTQWKKFKTFLEDMEKEGLVVLDDSGAALVIQSADYTHSKLMFDVDDFVPNDEESGDGDARMRVSDGKKKEQQKHLKKGKGGKKQKINVLAQRYRNRNRIVVTNYNAVLGVDVKQNDLSKLKQHVSAAVNEEATPDKRGKQIIFHCKSADMAIEAMLKVFSSLKPKDLVKLKK